MKFNNKVFKDVSKHDIISSREHTMQQNVELSNELYHLKKYVSELEQEKKDLQIKLDKARYCAECYKCEKCKDKGCINSILYNKKV